MACPLLLDRRHCGARRAPGPPACRLDAATGSPPVALRLPAGDACGTAVMAAIMASTARTSFMTHAPAVSLTLLRWRAGAPGAPADNGGAAGGRPRDPGPQDLAAARGARPEVSKPAAAAVAAAAARAAASTAPPAVAADGSSC